MSIGVSLVLIAVGAILRWAVSLSTSIGSSSVNWHIVGDVLMVVGVIGLLLSLLWLATARRRTMTTYTEGPRTYTEDPTVMP